MCTRASEKLSIATVTAKRQRQNKTSQRSSEKNTGTYSNKIFSFGRSFSFSLSQCFLLFLLWEIYRCLHSIKKKLLYVAFRPWSVIYYVSFSMRLYLCMNFYRTWIALRRRMCLWLSQRLAENIFLFWLISNGRFYDIELPMI